MNKAHKLFSSLKWINFVSRRFNKVDRSGRTAVTSILSSLGVCFGVLALIVVISVMNGFQMEFIDAIMEISSYHVRVSEVENHDGFIDWCKTDKNVSTVVPFYEAQGLMLSSSGQEGASLVRAIDPDVMEKDPGFKKELKMISGDFDLSEDDYIVLGNDLAASIGAKTGGTVTIFALSGSSDVSLFSNQRSFVVKGIFFSNYADINSAYSFISLDAGKKNFGESAKEILGIKIKDSNKDSSFIAKLNEKFPDVKADTWRSYNRAFFGALRVEKNMLMLLVFLIFVVVAINIYNGMRRMVYERREEIAVLTALGSSKRSVQAVFIYKGFITGITGALPGLLLGLLLCVNMRSVFLFLSKALFYVQYFITMIVSPGYAYMMQENPMFRIYASIPARMVFSEIILIFFFGIFASLSASWFASRQILKVTVAEVLHDD
ncbi:MAG: ABC transporter permease [Treponema sp.]|nr:ABC transporter permease [Treponema sp.]